MRDFAATGLELPPLGTHEFSGFVGAERDLGARWEARLGATFSIWNEAVTGSASAPGISVQVLRKPPVRGVTGRADFAWNPEYVRVALAAAWPIALGRLRLTPGLRYGWGRHLPPQHQFTLGGYEGFPGLRLGELRGNHEALARLHLSYRVVGPFRVTAGGAGGLAAGDGGAFPNGTWRLGARLGLGFDVPLAPVRIEYGRSTGGRAALFLRVGGWF